MAALHSGQGEEREVAQPADDVRLCECYPRLDGRLVARAPRPGWQDAHAVMRRHRRVAAVHLGVVERGLFDAALEIVGDQQPRGRPEVAEHAHVGADPVRQRLRPGRLGVGEAGGTEHGHEDLRHADLAGHRIGDRHPLAGVVDERLVPGHVLLTHCRRQPPLELAEQLAEPAIGIAVGMNLSILVPQNLQVDGGTLELQRQRRPVRLGAEPCPGTHAAIGEQPRHQSLVGEVRGQRPTDPRRRRSGQILPHRARRDAQLPPDRPRARPSTKAQRQQLPYPPHGQPLCRHPAPPSIAMAALDARSLLTRETIHPSARRSAGAGGIVRMVGGLRSEPWAASDQNAGRHQIGMGGRLTLEPATRCQHAHRGGVSSRIPWVAVTLGRVVRGPRAAAPPRDIAGRSPEPGEGARPVIPRGQTVCPHRGDREHRFRHKFPGRARTEIDIGSLRRNRRQEIPQCRN